MQLLNLRGGAGDMVCVYPEGSGSARALTAFLQNFDSRSTSMVRFEPIAAGQSLPIEPDRHFLRAFATDPSGPVLVVLHSSILRLSIRFWSFCRTELDSFVLRLYATVLTQHGEAQVPADCGLRRSPAGHGYNGDNWAQLYRAGKTAAPTARLRQGKRA